ELRFQQPLLLPIIPLLVLLASITYSTLLIVALVLAGFVARISAPFGRLRVVAGLLCSHFYLTQPTASKWQSSVPWTFPATGLCKCIPLLWHSLLVCGLSSNSSPKCGSAENSV